MCLYNLFINSSKKVIYFFLIIPFFVNAQQKDSIIYVRGKKLDLLTTIKGRISPKSVVSNNKGLFFAQNMMYKHSITVYNRSFELVKTIPDNVILSDYGFNGYKGDFKGAPVECVFTHNGKYAWVSNYEMTGGTSRQFVRPGCDGCNSKNKYDSSYVYKINTETLKIENVIQVGCVPKYLAATPNNDKVLVTNWTSGDVSIISTKLNKEIKRISLGTFPRGIVVNKTSSVAYIAIMGSTKIAKLNLFDYSIKWIEKVGRHPRHLCLSPDNKTLYVSLNGEGKIAKIDLATKKIVKKSTGRLPRSMDISADGKFLYVVNYGSNEVTKLATDEMKIIAKAKTKSKPIGITFDEATKNIWTACYSGRIMVFHDTYYDSTAVNYFEQENLLAALKRKEKEEQKGRKSIKTNVTRKRRESKPIKNKPINGKYILVSGSFSESYRARNRVEELKKKGIKAGLYFNNENQRNYAYVGVFNSREEAGIASRNIDIDNWIYKLPKENQAKIKQEAILVSEKDLPQNLDFLIVSGSYKKESYAKRKVARLKSINKSAFVYFNPSNENYYACLGSFESRKRAKTFLVNNNLKGWVYKR